MDFDNDGVVLYSDYLRILSIPDNQIDKQFIQSA